MKQSDQSAKSRVSTGIFIAVVICAVIITSHIPAVMTAVVLVLNILALYELFSSAYLLLESILLILATTAVTAISLLPILDYDQSLLYVLPLAILIFWRIMKRIGKCKLDSSIKVFGITLLVAFLFKSIPSVRAMEHGFLYLIAAVLSGCITDIFAYLVGRKWGKHKLCPVISPKKTVEGSIGGTLATVASLLLLGWMAEIIVSVQVNYPLLTLYAVLSSVVGQFGDLSMSAVKRCQGVKDFGNLLPGHGGVLDRFDSLLMIAPFTLLFCRHIGPFFL